jgi:hypothetical protein
MGADPPILSPGRAAGSHRLARKASFHTSLRQVRFHGRPRGAAWIRWPFLLPFQGSGQQAPSPFQRFTPLANHCRPNGAHSGAEGLLFLRSSPHPG